MTPHASVRRSLARHALIALAMGALLVPAPTLAAERLLARPSSELMDTPQRRPRVSPETILQRQAVQALRTVFAPEIKQYAGLDAWLTDRAHPPLPRAIADLQAIRATNPSAGLTELTGNIRGNRNVYLQYMGIQAWIDQYAPPIITSIAPDAVIAGDRATIRGDRFSDIKGLQFGTRPLPTQDYIVVSPQELIVEIPETNSRYGPYAIAFTIRTAHGTTTSSSITQWTGTCTDARIGRAFTELLNTKPRGDKTQGQCDPAPYGAYTSYTDLLIKVAQRHGYTKRDAPVITEIAPGVGNPGDRITIRGRNLYQLTDVLFGNHRAAFTSLSADEITATAPGEGAGVITIITKSGSASSPQAFAFHPIPKITATTPAEVMFTDQPLTLFGEHLGEDTANTEVRIGNVRYPVETTRGAGEVIIRPNQPAQNAIITVRRNGRQSEFRSGIDIWTGKCRDPWITQAFQDLFGRPPWGQDDLGQCDYRKYRNGKWNNYEELKFGVRQVYGYGTGAAPTITRVDPPSPVAGTRVTIHGTGFTNLQSVIFGSNAAQDVVLQSNTAIAATVPYGAGSGDVVVGTLFGVARLAYTVQYPPVVSRIEPVNPRPGTTITLFGSHLDVVDTVMIGSATSTIREQSTTKLVVEVPRDLAGKHRVTAKSPRGDSAWPADIDIAVVKNLLGEEEYCFPGVGKQCLGSGDEWEWHGLGSQKILKPIGCSKEDTITLDGETFAARSCWVVPGSIKHDNCCLQHPSGKNCGGPGKNPFNKDEPDRDWISGKVNPAGEFNHDGTCVQEWDDAFWDVAWGRAWPALFRSQVPANISPAPSPHNRYPKGEVVDSASACAPDGTYLTAKHGAGFCCSGKFEKDTAYYVLGVEPWARCGNGLGSIVKNLKADLAITGLDLSTAPPSPNDLLQTTRMPTPSPITTSNPLATGIVGNFTQPVPGPSAITTSNPFSVPAGRSSRGVQGITPGTIEQGGVIAPPAPTSPPTPIPTTLDVTTKYCNPELPKYWQPGCTERPANAPPEVKYCDPTLPRIWQQGCVARGSATDPVLQPTTPTPAPPGRELTPANTTGPVPAAPSTPPIPPPSAAAPSVQYCDPELPKYWQQGCVEPTTAPTPIPAAPTPAASRCDPAVPMYMQRGCTEATLPPEQRITHAPSSPSLASRLLQPLVAALLAPTPITAAEPPAITPPDQTKSTATITVAPKTARPGRRLLVQGEGFTPELRIAVAIDGKFEPEIEEETEEDGSFDWAYVIPRTMANGPHELLVVDRNGVKARTSFTVFGSAVRARRTPPPTTNPSPSVPPTISVPVAPATPTDRRCVPLIPRLWQPGCIEESAPSAPLPFAGKSCDMNIPITFQPGCIEPERPLPALSDMTGKPCDPRVPKYTQRGCVE